ncbi:DEAD/DEAH box helicase [Luteolibacter sp. AS25]|uniref:DEAD/DEAH box helicase n=1 Tax=Luteolibacter sp. AS25 TaxID=3135776 RepID=UPI00398B760C
MPDQVSIHDILAEFRDDSLNNRDLGDRFERLICRYLELDPQYSERFSNVWMFNEWPRKGETGDIGIDIVAEEEATGEFVGIQCKFYEPTHQLVKGDIDSFVSALGKKLFSSGIIVSTTDKWGRNVEATLKDQTKPIQRLRVQDLDNSPVDWSSFTADSLNKLKLQKNRSPRAHQIPAIEAVKNDLMAEGCPDRGQLIMACGTGKTYTSLAIVEEVAMGGHVLFLVPSLALLAQTLREWTAFSQKPIHALAVCSDSQIGRRNEQDADNTDISISDLAFPATTNTKSLLHQYNALQGKIKRRKQSKANHGTTVVFSTYHSIASVSDAQKAGLPDFDLVICDEAHRTTGVTLADGDESHFVKIHDADYIRATKRLYMTATPKVFGDETKVKAAEADATLADMGDEDTFGPELYRLGFGEAVEKDLLTDYKVLVLAVDESYASKTFQSLITDSDNELDLDDAVRITGCWNGLSKKLDHTTTDEAELYGDLAPMRTAVAFSRSIKDSKAFCQYFAELVENYQADHPEEENLLKVELDHVDGGMNAITRGHKLDWLKEAQPANQCRILSNARCLSEGVDVPGLDSVMFLNPRNSVVDVVQSVGRVMRKAPGKQYGYIILPIGIPAGVTPEEALKDNKKYAIVWQVLQALRSHDDRFNAVINQIELNKKAPPQIGIIGIGGTDPNDAGDTAVSGKDKKGKVAETTPFPFFSQLGEWKDALYARIVKKCGERRYWEKWATNVAEIARRHIERITTLLDEGQSHHAVAFAKFLNGLHQNINPAITREEAIEMLSQHLITRPVFDALFEESQFSKHNPVSQAMEGILEALNDQALEKETRELDQFYHSVRTRAAGIDNAEGKQKVILELYDKFFATAFAKMSKRLGIVYTPVEIVDFIIHSVEDILQQEFKTSISDKDVHVIDPFTGTGTFIVRLLQSGLIKPQDLAHKYQNELHANEIVLLAYYIAAVNIEETYHALQSEAKSKYYDSELDEAVKHGVLISDPVDYETSYQPFDGIVLTDTFQLAEPHDGQQNADESFFPKNNKRVARQKAAPIRVVMSNPPYSVNDNPVPYPALDSRIEATYAARSTATNKNSLYDSYIRAIRWASDRIGDNGIVAFVTNGSFIDSNVCDGLRACLGEEFTTLYIFNARGNQRTSGELSRQEGGKVFGQGSRTPVAISLLVKNPAKSAPAQIHYHDIGNYLSREEKLEIFRSLESLNGLHRHDSKKWKTIKPNAEHDWINQRDPAFETFIPLNAEEDGELTTFLDRQNGVQTNRDAWVYSYSKPKLAERMKATIAFYNEQVEQHASECRAATKPADEAKKRIVSDDKQIKWTGSLISKLCQDSKCSYSDNKLGTSLYRPFSRQKLYYDRHFNHRYKERLFPTIKHENLVLSVPGVGETVPFCVFSMNVLPNLHTISGGQCFPLYLYEKVEASAGELDLSTDDPEAEIIDGYRRKSAISDAILATFCEAYGKKVTKEDIFYYVYGILHSPEYRERFAADLKKMLPRIPLTTEAADYQAFTQAGRDLAELHLNYETVPPHPGIAVEGDELALEPFDLYRVKKMTYARPTPEQKANGHRFDKTRIIYNANITISNIPEDAHNYIVNGKSALDWLLDRYQVKIDKTSGIKNDPNDWCREHDNPRYILDLLLSVAHVSIQTNTIVAGLPALNERK